jgi:AraC family transcriptional regulator
VEVAKERRPTVTRETQNVSLKAEIAHDSGLTRIRIVDCRPDHDCCGPEERATAPTLVLPLRGIFVKHRGTHTRIVADVCHGLFFNADEPYRVSHPVTGGDQCLSIEPARDALLDVMSAHDAAATARGDTIFRHTHVPLSAGMIGARKALWHRLARRMAAPLEADETALRLLGATVRDATMRRSAPSGERRRTQSRHRDIVDATKIVLASKPAEDWALSALAKRVYTSPYHLARMFRRDAGMPLHRYHLLTRMAMALDEVLDSSCDIATVGVGLGFSSHSHFTAVFRRSFGVTPSELRRTASVRNAVEMRKILTAI